MKAKVERRSLIKITYYEVKSQHHHTVNELSRPWRYYKCNQL